jgi:2'-5' RNA ligase
MRRKTAIVYWLVPAEPYRELFREIIRILAKQFDAPRFEPHLTLFATSQDSQTAKKGLRQIKARPIRLKIGDIAYSSKFTKTHFLQVGPTKSLDRLVVDLAGSAKPMRDPHVSLIYKKLPVPTKKELAAAIRLPFRSVVFDSIKAVRCPFPTSTRADVEAWRVIATKSLR